MFHAVFSVSIYGIFLFGTYVLFPLESYAENSMTLLRSLACSCIMGYCSRTLDWLAPLSTACASSYSSFINSLFVCSVFPRPALSLSFAFCIASALSASAFFVLATLSAASALAVCSRFLSGCRSESHWCLLFSIGFLSCESQFFSLCLHF